MPRSQQDSARRAPRHQGPPLLVRRGPVAENAVLPASGGSLILAAAVANTFTAWTLVGAAATNSFIPSQIKIGLSSIAANSGLYLVELALDSAGARPLDAFRFPSIISFTTGDASGFFCHIEHMHPAPLPAGTTIYARARQSFTATFNYEIMLLGWDNTYPDFVPLPSPFIRGPGRVYPTNISTGTAVTPGVWGTWGVWKEFVAAAPNDMLVTAIVPGSSLGNVSLISHMTQVGYGSAGAECPAATALWAHQQTSPIPHHPVWVKAGERIALRSQGDTTSARVECFKVMDLP